MNINDLTKYETHASKNPFPHFLFVVILINSIYIDCKQHTKLQVLSKKIFILCLSDEHDYLIETSIYVPKLLKLGFFNIKIVRL